MLVHKLNGAVGASLALSLAITATVVIVKRHSATYPLGIKGDRLEVVPGGACSQLAWPFGCGWQPSERPETRRRPGSDRRGQRHGKLRWLIS